MLLELLTSWHKSIKRANLLQLMQQLNNGYINHSFEKYNETHVKYLNLYSTLIYLDDDILNYCMYNTLNSDILITRIENLERDVMIEILKYEK